MSTTVILIGGAAAGLVVLAVGLLIEFSGRERTESQTASEGQNIVPILIVAGVFGLVICSVVYVIVSYMEKEPTAPAYSTELAELCDNIEGTSSPANLPRAVRPFRVAVMDYTGSWHDWHYQLPDRFRGEDRDTTDVVACVSEDRQQIVEECPYYSLGSTSNYLFTIQRVAIYNDVFLLNPATGKVFTVLRIWGIAPAYCPDTVKGERGAVEKQYGGYPEYETFYGELAKATQ